MEWVQLECLRELAIGTITSAARAPSVLGYALERQATKLNVDWNVVRAPIDFRLRVYADCRGSCRSAKQPLPIVLNVNRGGVHRTERGEGRSRRSVLQLGQESGF
jgi:hypothetical protein